jgi:hypothetical protein
MIVAYLVDEQISENTRAGYNDINTWALQVFK